jgi:hypothetical protein
MRESWAAMLACSLQPCVLGSQLRGRMSASSQATTGIWLLQGSLGQPFCRGENARGGRHFSENSLVTSVYLSSTGLAGCRLRIRNNAFAHKPTTFFKKAKRFFIVYISAEEEQGS